MSMMNMSIENVDLCIKFISFISNLNKKLSSKFSLILSYKKKCVNIDATASIQPTIPTAPLEAI